MDLRRGIFFYFYFLYIFFPPPPLRLFKFFFWKDQMLIQLHREWDRKRGWSKTPYLIITIRSPPLFRKTKIFFLIILLHLPFFSFAGLCKMLHTKSSSLWPPFRVVQVGRVLDLCLVDWHWWRASVRFGLPVYGLPLVYKTSSSQTAKRNTLFQKYMNILSVFFLFSNLSTKSLI